MTTAVLLSCLKIFCCRIMDVTLGTFRTMLTVKGRNKFAALVGFVEVFLWYIVVRDALSGAGPVIPTAIAYAGGYATGTFIGGKLSGLFISGKVLIQVITSGRDQKVLDGLRQAGYAITVIRIEANEYGPDKWMVMADVDKKHAAALEKLVKELDPKAFIMVQDTKSSSGGYFGDTAKKK
jgi:uncharacterized protein YebE (UPF0316 family)